MKKTMIFFLLMLISTTGIYSQVTIGNDTPPAATLDVVNTDDSTPAGVIAPRLTLTELAADDSKYLPAQTGAIVYVTNASGATTTKTAKVTAVGYYYFDGLVWQLVNGGTEWYTAGTANDAQTDKSGNISRSGQVALYNGVNPTTASAAPTAAFSIINETATDANDNISISTYSDANVTPSLLMYRYGGTKQSPLSLVQNQGIGNIQFGSTQGVLAGIYTRYRGTGSTKASELYFTTSGDGGGMTNARMLIDSIGNVGIGTLTPKTKLDINTATVGTGFKMTDGSQGDSKVLTSDANGVGTWQDLGIPTVTGTTTGSDQIINMANYTTSNAEVPFVSYTLPPGRWMIFYFIPYSFNLTNLNIAQVSFTMGFTSSNPTKFDNGPVVINTLRRDMLMATIDNTTSGNVTYTLRLGYFKFVNNSGDFVTPTGNITVAPAGVGAILHAIKLQ